MQNWKMCAENLSIVAHQSLEVTFVMSTLAESRKHLMMKSCHELRPHHSMPHTVLYVDEENRTIQTAME